MAALTSALTVDAKNELLKHLNEMKFDGGAKTNMIAAVNTSNELIGETAFTFGNPSDGVVNKSGGNIVIEIPSGQTIYRIRYYKPHSYGVNDDVINPMNIAPTTFEYGGKIVITQIKVTLT